MRLRPFATVSIAAASVVLLAGCAGIGGNAATPSASPSATAPVDLCDAMADPGAASDAVTVTGDAGAAPEVSFDSPLTVDDVQVTMLDEGDGEPLVAGDYISFAFNAFSAETGEPLGTAGYEPGEMLPVQISSQSGLGQLLGCSAPGTRVVATFPAAEATDTTQAAPAEVYVIDLLSVVPTAAWGTPQDPVDGMPVVSLADDGAPLIEIPDADPPIETEVATLKKGEGAEVATGDSVLIQFRGMRWSTGKLFDGGDTWDGGTPYSAQTTGFVPGFQKALEGHTVGSQVLVVIPPVDGYGEGEINETDLKGETLVFVVDILGVQHVQSE